jgi:hypothetical protein
MVTLACPFFRAPRRVVSNLQPCRTCGDKTQLIRVISAHPLHSTEEPCPRNYQLEHCGARSRLPLRKGIDLVTWGVSIPCGGGHASPQNEMISEYSDLDLRLDQRRPWQSTLAR